jgi:NAD(P)H dehydrogenase (quinone)
VSRGPGGSGRGAFISREDTAWAAAAAVDQIPGGVLDITGPELLGVADMARRLSAISGKVLCYDEESVEEMRTRLGKTDMPNGAIDLEVGWFQAIAAGEQSPVTETYRRLTGRNPHSLESYFHEFPDRLGLLR